MASIIAGATGNATDAMPVVVPPKPSVYVTLLTDDSFLPGVQTLIHSVDKHAKLARDFIVLVTPNVAKVTRKVLARKTGAARRRKVQVIVRQVDPIANPHATACHVAGWVNAGFTKLHIWALDEVRKLVCLLNRMTWRVLEGLSV
jgi:hypothetical protein